MGHLGTFAPWRRSSRASSRARSLARSSGMTSDASRSCRSIRWRTATPSWCRSRRSTTGSTPPPTWRRTCSTSRASSRPPPTWPSRRNGSARIASAVGHGEAEPRRECARPWSVVAVLHHRRRRMGWNRRKDQPEMAQARPVTPTAMPGSARNTVAGRCTGCGMAAAVRRAGGNTAKPANNRIEERDLLRIDRPLAERRLNRSGVFPMRAHPLRGHGTPRFSIGRRVAGRLRTRAIRALGRATPGGKSRERQADASRASDGVMP